MPLIAPRKCAMKFHAALSVVLAAVPIVLFGRPNDSANRLVAMLMEKPELPMYEKRVFRPSGLRLMAID